MRLAPTKVEWAVIGLIIFVPICVHFIAVGRWLDLNSPDGKFSTLGTYLMSVRPPARVARLHTPEGTYYVAYGSLAGSWLAVPSGPPAYVFDGAGALVYYSSAIGDDSVFHKKWPAASQQNLTSDEVKALRFQPIGSANGSLPIRSETNRTSSAAGSRR